MFDMFGCGGGCKPTRRFIHPHRPLPERGWIQFLLLGLLYESPMHGYQLMEEMEKRGYVRSGRFKTGSVYTILSRMERRGWLSSKKYFSEAGRQRRIYTVTSLGRDALKTGLEHMLRRKKLLDELEKYYERHFQNESQTDTKRGEKKSVHA